MITKTNRRKRPSLKVVFDTNALYTGSASDLLNHEVAELIKENLEHPDLEISWCLPETVRHERQYQMINKGRVFLEPLQKLEKLLGHNLNITREIIEMRINDVIEKQIKEYNIQEISLNIESVEWKQLCFDSVYRHPPFENSEKEKGFRDALISETFFQIVSSSPSTPTICRIVFITGDGRLSEHIISKTSGQKNVKVLSSIEETKNLINTLASEINEETIKKLRDKASTYFFEYNNEKSLYYKEEIDKNIINKFQFELFEYPSYADVRKNIKWVISHPRFIRKERQKVYWISQIKVKAEAYKYSVEEFPQFDFGASIIGKGKLADIEKTLTKKYLLSLGLGGMSLGKYGLANKPGEIPPDLYNSLGKQNQIPKQEILISQGASIFEVEWNVTVSIKDKFTSSKITDIKFKETYWDKNTSEFL